MGVAFGKSGCSSAFFFGAVDVAISCAEKRKCEGKNFVKEKGGDSGGG